MLQKATPLLIAFFCLPVRAEMTPEQTKALWDRLNEAHGRQMLEEYLSPETTEIIDWYGRQSEEALQDVRFQTEATPAAFAAGVVGGVISVAAEKTFDVTETYLGQNAPADLPAPQAFDLHEHGKGPQQMTPVLATAAAGAAGGVVGRRAAEYLAERFMGSPEPLSAPIKNSDFDLR